jgi:hypothetical protein
MSSTHDEATLDRQVRIEVYDRLMTDGKMPSAAEVAGRLDLGVDDVRAAYRRMKEGHILVLQEGDEEILMANPFSAVPTPFLVEAGRMSWWGNCIWDAMGVAAMVGENARISTGCGDCNDGMVLLVQGGSLEMERGEGVIHFSVPARRWWDNIKFT